MPTRRGTRALLAVHVLVLAAHGCAAAVTHGKAIHNVEVAAASAHDEFAAAYPNVKRVAGRGTADAQSQGLRFRIRKSGPGGGIEPHTRGSRGYPGQDTEMTFAHRLGGLLYPEGDIRAMHSRSWKWLCKRYRQQWPTKAMLPKAKEIAWNKKWSALCARKEHAEDAQLREQRDSGLSLDWTQLCQTHYRGRFREEQWKTAACKTWQAGCCARLNCFGPSGFSDTPGGAYNALFLGANQLPKWHKWYTDKCARKVEDVAGYCEHYEANRCECVGCGVNATRVIPDRKTNAHMGLNGVEDSGSIDELHGQETMSQWKAPDWCCALALRKNNWQMSCPKEWPVTADEHCQA